MEPGILRGIFSDWSGDPADSGNAFCDWSVSSDLSECDDYDWRCGAYADGWEKTGG